MSKLYIESESLKRTMWKNFCEAGYKWKSTPEANFLDAHGGCPCYWFQLGFGVGLDAVVKAEPIEPRMSAVEFVRAWFRFTRDFNEEKWDVFCRCHNATTIEEAVAIVEKWAREHPERSEDT